MRKRGINLGLKAFFLDPQLHPWDGVQGLGGGQKKKITEKKFLWFLEDSSATYLEYLSVCCSKIKNFSVMFHLVYISTTFRT